MALFLHLKGGKSQFLLDISKADCFILPPEIKDRKRQMLSCPRHKGTNQRQRIYIEEDVLRWVSGSPGQGWSTARSQVGRQSHLGQGRGSLLSRRSTSRSGISEPGQEGLTGVPGPEEFTPEAPGSGTGFSAQAWRIEGEGPRRPGGAERAV